MHNSASVKLFFVNINLFAVMEIPFFRFFYCILSLLSLYFLYIQLRERDFMAWQEKCIKALSDQNLLKIPGTKHVSKNSWTVTAIIPFSPEGSVNACTYPPGMKSIFVLC